MDLKNNDCYFFYYSSCEKGDDCPYRHCANALGETKVCKYWLKHQCERVNCPFRHMNSKKDRNSTPCFHEDRGGCMKPHCPYAHSKPRKQLQEALKNNDCSLILPVRSPNSKKDAKQKVKYNSGIKTPKETFDTRSAEMSSESENESEYESFDETGSEDSGNILFEPKKRIYYRNALLSNLEAAKEPKTKPIAKPIALSTGGLYSPLPVPSGQERVLTSKVKPKGSPPLPTFYDYNTKGVPLLNLSPPVMPALLPTPLQGSQLYHHTLVQQGQPLYQRAVPQQGQPLYQQRPLPRGARSKSVPRPMERDCKKGRKKTEPELLKEKLYKLAI